jgi:hypothetical protein
MKTFFRFVLYLTGISAGNGMVVALAATIFSFRCDGQAYTYAQIPLDTLPLPQGTLVTYVDDQVKGPFPIGFDFCFWGLQYNQVWIGSNGWVGFSAGQPIAFTPFPLPTLNAFIPKNCIMGPFHDINPGVAGTSPNPIEYVYYRTDGVAPFRRFIVSWHKAPLYTCVVLLASQQIILYESTNVIRNSIIRKPTCFGWVNGRAIHGLHNVNGTDAVVVAGRNATTWGGNSWIPETWEFYPEICCPFEGEIFFD